MRKLILVVAMLAVVLVAAAPVIAQSQGFSERRITSGKASPSVAVSNKGDNANLCPSVQQVANTGQVANEQGALPFETKIDGIFGDIDFAGSELTVTPSETAECTQTISQAAAAGKAAAS